MISPARRQLLQSLACGFGGLAFSALERASGGALTARPAPFVPRAKRVIFLFMQGGPSHVDSFDYKPELIARDGQTIDFTGVRFGDFGTKTQQTLMKPLWNFEQRGETGRWVSELFPHMGQCVDDLCFLQGVHTDGVAHGPCTLFLHTGATNLVRPSVGAWISYGLGTENENLPAFVTISPPASNGGPRNYAHAFLPAVHQATVFGRASLPATRATIDHLSPPDATTYDSRQQYDFVNRLNSLQRTPVDPLGDQAAVLHSFELAYRMQMRAPELLDLNDETEATQRAYGLDHRATENFGRQCLLARKLAEAGVRYIQVNYADESANPKWDQHANMPDHRVHAQATDRPVAALLQDLKQRGLLEDTLVWWGGEFGRTPFSQNKTGRDHNPQGFTMILAGGGVRAGYSFGRTDEIGHEAVEGRIHMHDMHATLLHLLGLDHRQLTYRYAGRDFRLTDLHGRIIQEIMA